MSKIALSVDFDISQDQLFDFFSAHENLSSLIKLPVKRIKDADVPGDVNGPGSVRAVGFGFLGLNEVIITYEKPNLIQYVIEDIKWPLKHHIGTMRFIDLGDGRSRLDYNVELELGWGLGLAELGFPILGRLVQTLVKFKRSMIEQRALTQRANIEVS